MQIGVYGGVEETFCENQASLVQREGDRVSGGGIVLQRSIWDNPSDACGASSLYTREPSNNSILPDKPKFESNDHLRRHIFT